MQNKFILHYLSRPKVCPLPLGLGDFLRGLTNSHILCEKYDYEMKINKCSNDVFKNFKDVPEYECYDVSQTQIKEVYFTPDDVDTTINNLFKEQNKELNVYTNLASRNFNGNSFSLWPKVIPEKTLSYLKSILQPTEYLKDLINSVLPNKKAYSVVHVRSGDADLFNGKPYDQNDHRTLDSKRLSILFELLNNVKTNDKLLLICDSEKFANIIKNKYPDMIYINSEKSAIACDCLTDQERADTLVDFFAAARANKIYSYSIYGISGFTYSASKIFNVPFEGSGLGGL